MKITEIQIKNFKSLVNFRLPLAHFNCLVGLNGSGKSTVLQCLDFLAQQIRGNLIGWLEERRWDKSDINSKLIKQNNIEFTVWLTTTKGEKIEWDASFNLTQMRCTREQIKLTNSNQILLQVVNSKYRITNSQNQLITLEHIFFEYQGSILSQLKDEVLNNILRELKNFFNHTFAMDLLSPELLRQRARSTDKSIGLGGERLSAFLHTLTDEERQQLQATLNRIYPSFKRFEITSMRSGWKKLIFQEQFNGEILETEARHIADGYLRILAVLAQLSQQQKFLLLDEIENGINPELIEFLMDTLVLATPQILVTTHSPMVLNYLEDEVAKAGVIYLYRTPQGETQAIHLFNIPSMQKKLQVMGPGAVYEDTLLTQLHQEIFALKKG